MDGSEDMIGRVSAIKDLAAIPMKSEHATERVEIIVLKYREDPAVIGKCLSRVVNSTNWPFKLTVYDNRPNTANMSKIWNKLVRESTCDYVVILDSDAFVPEGIDPCWLSRMMESVHNGAGIVLAVGASVGGANRGTPGTPYPAVRNANGIWSGFCILITKKAFETVGPFDEDFYLYGQDSEWSHRALKKRERAIFREDVFVEHIGSHSAKKSESEGTLDREADRAYAGALYRLKTAGKL